ncbi:hypothetical protein K5D68_04305 [Pseudomonas cichorii]|uniref:Uncharacterized protein n=1 Tax=Pseudomonas serbiensis TaxID=3064350 RepID=A0ABT9CUN5_9PSED|nr:hypothetical protein [Pseudomonas sp. KFB-138]MBX8548823.1 hypothetical protein [Pseudomonas cichorii]MBX8587473.1 hypothetical protein [Pseudomonas cichorii]MDO7929201.1 hypothetical protein [Pseudomonas sp. KFB-138]
MAKRRARNLDDQAIERIVGVLDGWSGKLYWDLLIEAIEKRLGVRYTRQALDKHARIKSAYQATKTRLSKVPGSEPLQKLSTVEVGALTERLKRLEAENARLKVENESLLEQFVTWAYNAYLKGMTKEYLSTPLPRVDRELTKLARTKRFAGDEG